jgi:hypothetical protein
MITGEFKFGTDTVKMELGFKLAYGKLNDLGLDILSITKNTQEVITTIMFDDTTMIKIWWYYINEGGYANSFEEALDVLDESPKGLEPFRKAFWDMVVGFSPTAVQDTLRSLWRQVEKEVKKSADKTISTSTSSSPQDSE